MAQTKVLLPIRTTQIGRFLCSVDNIRRYWQLAQWLMRDKHHFFSGFSPGFLREDRSYPGVSLSAQ